ncbi:MAG: recombination regulator RecX [Burkholderiales bacterium]
MGSKPTLRERAIACLAQREHSRAELARKLARHADDPDEIPPLLDELVRRKLLSDDRYAEVRANALARKFGATRIAWELRAKGVDNAAIAEATREVRATELSRAREAWAKRFGRPPGSAAERAKQIRFLQGRGFSFDAIRKVISGVEDA